MSDLAAYHRMRANHRWVVPRQYNVARDVCDKHPPEKLAMIWTDGEGPDRRVRWGELQDLSSRFASYYSARGVRHGDRVGVLSPTTAESAAALLGVLKIGAIGMPMSTLWSDDSLRYRITDADARLLVIDSATAARGITDAVVETLLLDERGLAAVRACPTHTDTTDTLADDPALLYYTSGSTGRPKGVLAPHRSLIGHNEFEYCQDLRDGELSYWMGDWAWGVYKILGPWRYGAVNVVYATGRRFDAAGLLGVLSRLGVSNVFLNPTGLRIMMNAVPDAGIRFPQKFRVVCAANEPLGKAESAWFAEQFGVPVLENYGMTEAYPMIGNFPDIPRKEGSMGLPVPGWDVAILDEDEQPVPSGESGEICLRARSNPQYPLGYWGRAAETSKDFGGTWFHTKDIAWADPDGYVFYVGRKDDVIKSAGYRISPFEIEEACSRHPAVAEAGVIGIADTARGHRVKAFVVLCPGYEPSLELAENIKRFVKKGHSAFGYPKLVEFVRELPRGQSGKLGRAQLRSWPAGCEY
ncbi:acyl-CoA synthetase [Saccharopolyspora sp. NPDC000995]